jgi:hypothetical protein
MTPMISAASQFFFAIACNSAIASRSSAHGVKRNVLESHFLGKAAHCFRDEVGPDPTAVRMAKHQVEVAAIVGAEYTPPFLLDCADLHKIFDRFRIERDPSDPSTLGFFETKFGFFRREKPGWSESGLANQDLASVALILKA